MNCDSKQVVSLAFAAMLVSAAGCASTSTATPSTTPTAVVVPTAAQTPPPPMERTGPDPRVGLRAGLMDAGEAVWNMRVLSKTPPPPEFVGKVNSDLAFTGQYAIQGSFSGFQVWDISNPAAPTLVNGYVCPASQSDVSVYRNLLFVSGEDFGARLDCGTSGVQTRVSGERFRGIRVFDITDIRNPKNVANVQTCRGSHTHTVLESPNDKNNVYVYVSGSAPVRPAEELAGCVGAMPSEDPASALFRIEVIRVPLANPATAAIVSSPRIFEDLVEAETHGQAPDDLAQIRAAEARGAYTVDVMGTMQILPDRVANMWLDSIVKARGGTGAPTAADSATLRRDLPAMVARMIGQQGGPAEGPQPGPNQCHDITVYPAIGLAGGACEGYGLLLDISDPVNPRRLDAVADSNFAYWHSATFNNAGTTVIFTDEWGGGGAPKCRANDPKEWGANAIFRIVNGKMVFQDYYKLPVVQTPQENCVAHNGSLIPIPGRDIMVQAWYQGGLSVFDFTDPNNAFEIAFFDRGPINAGRMEMGGSWSVYWYNGAIVSSEIARGLDILELAPSEYISQNEIDAANTVRFDYLNAQGQQQLVWPASFALARAYVDQLERSNGLATARIAAARAALASAERASGSARATALRTLASQLDSDAAASRDAAKVRLLAEAVRGLASAD